VAVVPSEHVMPARPAWGRPWTRPLSVGIGGLDSGAIDAVPERSGPDVHRVHLGRVSTRTRAPTTATT